MGRGRWAAGTFVHNDDPLNTEAASWGASAADRGRWRVDAASWQVRHVSSLHVRAIAGMCNPKPLYSLTELFRR